MCYNKSQKFATSVGQIAVSVAGHDAGRAYLVVATVSPEFVLVSDGRLRTLANPKLKRVKHVRAKGESEIARQSIEGGTITDAQVRKILEKF